MKVLFLFCTLLLIPLLTFAQTVNANKNENPAKGLHDDVAGMKMYVLVLLKTGTNRSTDRAYRNNLFASHMAMINQLVSLKKIVVTGPLKLNGYAYRSILVLDVNNVEEAKKQLADDPAIDQDMFATEFYLFEGPATLPAYLIKPL
jgi:uncharacterized protein YciI